MQSKKHSHMKVRQNVSKREINRLSILKQIISPTRYHQINLLLSSFALSLYHHKHINMKKIAKSLTDLIGNTPLLELSNYNKKHELNGILVAKLEYFNPAGSVKDRIALSMIEEAEQKGLLKSHATIIEPTSGNTGVGLAFVSAARGYRLILTMPDTMSMERRNLLKALGAQLILTPGSEGMAGHISNI